MIKMRLILLFLLLCWQQAFAQKAHMPFELERYSADVYDNMLSTFNTNFENEQQALEFYFLAYKAQRAASPAQYFPLPNEHRKNAASFIKSTYPTGFAIALIGFLENEGSPQFCNTLIHSSSDLEILLPYKFMAAYLLSDKSLENEYLRKMDQAGMLSDVLKNFGANAVQSIPEKTIIISQGMQDLISIKYGVFKSGLDMDIMNVFSAKCEGFDRVEIDKVLSENKNHIWISPSISTGFAIEHKQSLYLWGIGFALSDADKNLVETMQNVGRNFAGLNDNALTPADKGLIRSYSYFAKAYQAFTLESGNNEDQSQNVIINRFIKKQTKK